MPSRFGLKDGVVVLLLLAVGLSIWIKMVQDDRQWSRLARIESRLGEIDRRIGELSRVDGAAAPGPGPVGSSTATAPGASAPIERDESWAIEGVPIRRQPAFAMATDPRTQPGFSEGGELTELLEGDPVCITPLVSRTSYARRVVELVCEGLADYHPATLALRGRLAEAWQFDASGEGCRLRVRIRDEARFSDGSPVTAADVVWTFEEVVLNPLVEGVGARAELGELREVKALGERVVEFEFSGRTFTLEALVLTQPVLPRGYYGQFTPARLMRSTGLLRGSGPYRLKVEGDAGSGGAAGDEWKKDTPVVLERNERYWGPRPALDRIRFTSARDPVARLEAYRRGEADMVTPSSAQMSALQADEAFGKSHRLLSWLDAFKGLNAIAWQCGTRGSGAGTPFADARVRRAMTMLLDREMMLRVFYQGQGELASGPFNPRSPMSSPTLKPMPFDPEGAQALLAEAGWRDRDGDGVLEDEQGRRFEFEFTRLASQESDRLTAAYLVDQCAKAKIICRDNPVADSAAGQIVQTHEFDAVRWSNRFFSPEPDPMAYWHSASIAAASGGRNFCGWTSDEADRLIETGRRELDAAARRAVWTRLEELIAREQPWTFIRYAPALCIARRTIGNVQAYPVGLQLWEMYRVAETRSDAGATDGRGAPALSISTRGRSDSEP
ncbi:MAG: ABC transporter substrate-binding protein [Phycisphaerales bacterium]